MMPTIALRTTPAGTRPSPDDVRIGKDLVEILTSGMYVSPLAIFREYVQNAADSIDLARTAGSIGPDDGRVSIEFDHAARSLTIRDNGAGVPIADAVRVLLALGSSPKRGSSARGFRGVGRLSGLAYCRELVFRTKARGETHGTSIAWDCRLLRERLGDVRFDGDLQRMMSDAVSVTSEPAHRDEHFFEVRMLDVARHRNDLLLNDRLVAHYLAQVAPVSFAADFSLAQHIIDLTSKHEHRTPIKLFIGGQEVRRLHRDELSVPGVRHTWILREIESIEIPDVDGRTGAILWLAHHDYHRSIAPLLGVRGIRARVGDLQVGDAILFDESFKEVRFNGWTVGELHVLDPRVVPNARRDNFEFNHHYYNLLVQLGPIAAAITQRCRSSSVSRTASVVIENTIQEITDRLKEKRRFDRAELSRYKSMVLRARSKLKRLSEGEQRNKWDRALERLMLALSRLERKRGGLVVAYDEAAALVGRIVTNRDQARKLLEQLRQLGA